MLKRNAIERVSLYSREIRRIGAELLGCGTDLSSLKDGEDEKGRAELEGAAGRIENASSLLEAASAILAETASSLTADAFR